MHSVITCSTGGCHDDNHQWRQSWHHDNSWFFSSGLTVVEVLANIFSIPLSIFPQKKTHNRRPIAYPVGWSFSCHACVALKSAYVGYFVQVTIWTHVEIKYIHLEWIYQQIFQINMTKFAGNILERDHLRYRNESGKKIFVRVMSHEGYSISNYQQLNSLFTILFYADNKEDINLWNVIMHPCCYLRLPMSVLEILMEYMLL